MRRRWLELDLVLGKKVRIIAPEILHRRAVNVDEYGALLVQEQRGRGDAPFGR